MDRNELLQTKEYWITSLQIAIYNCAMRFMEEHEMNRTQLAQYLGVTKGYVSQLLNGDFDHRISKLVELALAFGVVPEFNFTPISEYVARDNFKIKRMEKANDSKNVFAFTPATTVVSTNDWLSINPPHNRVA